jgi:hypothetical protein
VDAAALPSLPRAEARDIDLLGTWWPRRRHRLRGDHPARWSRLGTDDSVTEMLTWVGRHVIRHVQAAFQ